MTNRANQNWPDEMVIDIDAEQANKVTALEVAALAHDIKSLAETLTNAAMAQQWEHVAELLASITAKSTQAVISFAGRQ